MRPQVFSFLKKVILVQLQSSTSRSGQVTRDCLISVPPTTTVTCGSPGVRDPSIEFSSAQPPVPFQDLVSTDLLPDPPSFETFPSCPPNYCSQSDVVRHSCTTPPLYTTLYGCSVAGRGGRVPTWPVFSLCGLSLLYLPALRSPVVGPSLGNNDLLPLHCHTFILTNFQFSLYWDTSHPTL